MPNYGKIMFELFTNLEWLDSEKLEDLTRYKDFIFLWREYLESPINKNLKQRNKSLGCKSSRRPTITENQKVKKTSENTKQTCKQNKETERASHCTVETVGVTDRTTTPSNMFEKKKSRQIRGKLNSYVNGSSFRNSNSQINNLSIDKERMVTNSSVIQNKNESNFIKNTVNTTSTLQMGKNTDDKNTRSLIKKMQKNFIKNKLNMNLNIDTNDKKLMKKKKDASSVIMNKPLVAITPGNLIAKTSRNLNKKKAEGSREESCTTTRMTRSKSKKHSKITTKN